jgi:hypothetical protein
MVEVVVIVAVGLSVVGVLLCRDGSVGGPVLVATGFAGLGLLFVLGGTGTVDRIAGFLYLGGSAVELVAARAFAGPRAAGEAPRPPWGTVATLVGVAGLVVLALVVAYAVVAVMAWLSNLP